VALKALLVKAILEGADPVIDLAALGLVQAVQPARTETDSAESIQLISEARTSYRGSADNRIKNIRRALQCFNALEVKPGETVRFNTVTGRRTLENGFFEANEYLDGEVVTGVGGGTCQVSTTLYQALLKADVLVEQRSNHGMTVDYTQPSLDAAVLEDKKDLVFTNLQPTSIYIYTLTEGYEAIVRIYGQPLGYRVELESVVVSTFTNNAKDSSNVRADTSGKYATYTDEYVIAKEGKRGVNSYAIKVYVDASGSEIRREQLGGDYYMAQKSNYYVGIIDRATGLPAAGFE
jgi:vancomycin resistance protein YoaR